MDFDFSTLITDRSPSDLELLRDLLSTPMSDWTAEQLAAFNQAASKGAYNYTDLNRVTACMDYLNERLTALGYVTGYKPVEVPHGGSGSRLPEGYTELEYIESTGTQYIDTLFKPNQDTRVVMDFALLSINGQYADPIFGVRTSATANAYYLWCPGTTSSDERYQSGYNNGSTYPAVTRVGRHTVDKDKNVTMVDGVTTEAAYAAFTTAWNMLLFQSYNNGNLYSQTTHMRLYSCQIYDNGQLIRNFVSCTNPSGAAGLYDRIGNQFYGNAGSGAFVAGPKAGYDADPGEEPQLNPYTWYEEDTPSSALMSGYISNVSALRGAVAIAENTPAVPGDMTGLTLTEANNIEQILDVVNDYLVSLQKIFLRSGMAWAVSGGPGFYFSN